MIRRLARIAFILMLPLVSASAQPVSDDAPARARDAAANRLFFMSTGRIMEPGRPTLGLHELLVLQAGYAPNDFMQFNVTANPFPGYLSAGVKAQVLQPVGYFQGLAVGVDVGAHTGMMTFGGRWQLLGTANMAASVGNDEVQLHANMLGVTSPGLDLSRMEMLMQTGASVALGSTELSGARLMGEVWLSPREYRPAFGMVGIRTFGRVVSWELALMFMQGFSFAGHTSSRSTIVALPYLSIGMAL